MKVWDNNLTYSLESDQKDMILLWYLRYPYSKKFETSMNKNVNLRWSTMSMNC